MSFVKRFFAIAFCVCLLMTLLPVVGMAATVAASDAVESALAESAPTESGEAESVPMAPGAVEFASAKSAHWKSALVGSGTAESPLGESFPAESVPAAANHAASGSTAANRVASGPAARLPGDVNNDSVVDVDDILAVRAHIMGGTPLTGASLAAALLLVPGSTTVDLDHLLGVRSLLLSLVQTVYEAGEYLVGTDIPAGIYMAFPDDTEHYYPYGYFEVANGFYDPDYDWDNWYSFGKSFYGACYFEVKDGETLLFERGTFSPLAYAPSLAPADGVYDDGMYLVGRDIDPGQYVFVPISIYWNDFFIYRNCYYNHDSDFFYYRLQDTMGIAHVELKAGQYIVFESGTLIPADDVPPYAPKRGIYRSGVYKVGRDIPAGTYEVLGDYTNGSSCWFKLKNATGDINARIASGFIRSADMPTGDYYIDGMFKVGKDLPAGIYDLLGLNGSWAILSDCSGSKTAIVTEESMTMGPRTVTLLGGQYLLLNSVLLLGGTAD